MINPSETHEHFTISPLIGSKLFADILKLNWNPPKGFLVSKGLILEAILGSEAVETGAQTNAKIDVENASENDANMVPK